MRLASALVGVVDDVRLLLWFILVPPRSHLPVPTAWCHSAPAGFESHRARQQKVAESTGSSMSGTRLVVSSSRNTWSRRRRWTGAMEEGLHLPRRQRLLVHVSGFIPSRCARRIGQHQFVAVFDIGAGKRVGLHAAGPYRRRGRSSVPRTRSGRSGLIRRRQRPAGAALW